MYFLTRFLKHLLRKYNEFEATENQKKNLTGFLFVESIWRYSYNHIISFILYHVILSIILCNIF